MTLDARIAEASTRLRDVVTAHSPATFASSFGAEDMVILDLIAKLEIDVEVFTLDTGRLHEETHALIALARQKYQRPIKVMYPDSAELESFVVNYGNNAFYDSVELRKRCCAIRKVVPLRRALDSNPKARKKSCMKSTARSISSLTWSGRQKMWASS